MCASRNPGPCGSRNRSASRSRGLPTISTERVVYLTLGSNIDPETNLPAAVRELDRAIGVDAVSRVYEADPVGAPGSPRFLNAAVSVRTRLALADLKFAVLRPLEARLGRVRTSEANAPRTIDVDIALVGGASFSDVGADIEVPDPEIASTAHLALPLRDLAPDLSPERLGDTLAEIAGRLEADAGIQVREDVDLSLALDPGSRADG